MRARMENEPDGGAEDNVDRRVFPAIQAAGTSAAAPKSTPSPCVLDPLVLHAENVALDPSRHVDSSSQFRRATPSKIPLRNFFLYPPGSTVSSLNPPRSLDLLKTPATSAPAVTLDDVDIALLAKFEYAHLWQV